MARRARRALARVVSFPARPLQGQRDQDWTITTRPRWPAGFVGADEDLANPAVGIVSNADREFLAPEIQLERGAGAPLRQAAAGGGKSVVTSLMILPLGGLRAAV